MAKKKAIKDQMAEWRARQREKQRIEGKDRYTDKSKKKLRMPSFG